MRNRLPLLLVTILLLVTGCLYGQVDRTGLTGTVKDSSGLILPHTQVTAEQDATGLRRVTETSLEGIYDIPELPVGAYTVTFTHAGFQPLVFGNVVQAVEQTRTLNAVLHISGEHERVEVTASSLQLDQTSNALGSRIERKQVKELPLDGRNWATLTALAPTALDTGGSNQRSVRFAGRGRDDNDFTYDGIDATNIINQAQQPYVRLAIPTDTIQEFRVETNLATAESGATAGGQLSLTSPSGNNQFHGDAFEFLRNQVFDARKPIDALNPSRPPFHLNQFGGSLGGPIVRNKTFFFAAYEGYRQSLGQTLPGFVPSDAFRSQVTAESPELAPIVNAYPEGQTLLSAEVAQFVGQGLQLGHEDSGMVRVDHRFSEKTTAFVRFSDDSAVSNVPLASSGQYLNGRQDSHSAPVNAALELLTVLSPTLVNEGKFGFNRSTAINTNLNQNGALYAISVSGFTALNNNRTTTGVGNSLSWIDNLTWVKGRQVIKAGVEVRRIQLNQGSTANGTVSYASADDFASNLVNTASLTAALPLNGLRKTAYFGYVQDEFKWSANLTLNLGLRYSFFNIFHEVYGRAIPFDFATCGPQGFCGAGTSFGRANYGDIDPRIAFAWTPALLNGKTVIRAGFGTYHEDGQLEDQNLPENNEVQRFSLSRKTISGLSYPIDNFLATATGIVSPRNDDRRRKDASATQWGLSVQRSLSDDIVATVAYAGSKGTHLLTTSYVNMIDPVTGIRPYPDFGQVEFRGNNNNSFYHALVLNLQRPFSKGLLLSANYTWSHSIDDGSEGSGDGDAQFPENVACRSCERASSVFDARHVFNANAVYELPFGSGKAYLNQPGALRGVLGGWQLTTIVSAHTGFPVNVTIDRSASTVPDGNTVNQRPDLVPGISLTPLGGRTASGWINPAAFAIPAPGTFGDAPRNAVRGAGAWQTDVGLSKLISLTEHLQLQLRAEAFNIFNHTELGPPQADVSSAASFGEILSPLNTGPVGSGTPRQLQFMVRFLF